MSFSNFNRFVTPAPQFLDANGAPIPLAKLYFYSTGTLIAKDTYSDQLLTTVNANPVECDADGYLRQNVFFAPEGDYRIILKNQNDVVIWDKDPVPGTQLYGLTATVPQLNSTDTSFLNKSADYSVVATDWGKTISMDASGGTRTITLLPALTAGNGWGCFIIKQDDSSNPVNIVVSGGGTINFTTSYQLGGRGDGAMVRSNGYEYFIESTTPDTTVNNWLEYLITSAGISPVNRADETQVAQSVNEYVHAGNYYVDDPGTVNQYVAIRGVSDPEFETPNKLVDGMLISFLPRSTNTGAADLEFTTKEGTTNHPITYPDGSALLAGAIQEFIPGYIFQYESGTSQWHLINDPTAHAGNVYKVLAVADDPGTPGYLDQKLAESIGNSPVLKGGNTRVGFDARKYMINIAPTSTTAVCDITDPATGTLLCQISVNFGTENCDLDVKLIISKCWQDQASPNGSAFRIQDETNAIIAGNDYPNIEGISNGSPVILSAKHAYTGSTKTYSVYYGSDTSGGGEVYVLPPTSGATGATFEIQGFTAYA